MRSHPRWFALSLLLCAGCHEGDPVCFASDARFCLALDGSVEPDGGAVRPRDAAPERSRDAESGEDGPGFDASAVGDAGRDAESDAPDAGRDGEDAALDAGQDSDAGRPDANDDGGEPDASQNRDGSLLDAGDGDAGDGDAGDGDAGDGEDAGDGDAGDGEDAGDGGGTPAPTCVPEGAPTDIVVAIDTSGSMLPEACVIGSELSRLAALERPDTHVVTIYMLGTLELFTTTDCGIADPIAASGLAADPDRYRHVAAAVDSFNALSVLVEQFSSYASLLRADAETQVVVISDDDVSASGPSLNPQDFKTSMESKLGHAFTFHAIVAMDDGTCGAAVGTQYLALASETGGQSASLCSGDFGPVWNAAQNCAQP